MMRGIGSMLILAFINMMMLLANMSKKHLQMCQSSRIFQLLEVFNVFGMMTSSYYDFERIYTLMDTFSENYREYMVK